ncbi:MAG: hypothetical protein RRZ34_00380 [Malacoplasma sp.]
MVLTASFKKAKQSKQSKGNKTISSFALIGIAILAIFSFNNIIDNYTGLGLSSVGAFAVATVVYLLPFSFIIAEMASIKLRSQSNSGLTNWVNTCIGRKTSFITSYMFWFANLFYFVGAVPSRLNYIAFGFTGADYTTDATFNLVVPFVAVALFALITFLSTLNTKKISKFTSVGAWVIMGLTGLFFVVAIIGWIAGSVDSTLLPNTEAPGLVPDSKLDIWGESSGMNFLWMSTFIWVLMAADGAQSLGVYVNDVRGGSKTFSKSIIIAVLAIGFVYIFGTLLVSVFPPKVEGVGTLANNLVNAYFNMFHFMFQGVISDPLIIKRITYVIIGLSYTFVLGGILVWTSAPVRTFFSEIPTGVFGSTLPKQNRNGSPVKGAWIQFLIVAPLLLIPALGIGQLSEFFGFIKTSSGWIGMIPPLIIFVAYFNLRLKKDNLERSFKMGNRKTGLVISGFMIAVFIAILIVTFLDVPLDKPVADWGNTWWLNVTYKIVCLIVLVLPIYFWYLRYEKIIRETKIAKNLGLNEKLVLYKYSLSRKVNQFFYMDLVNEKIAKIDALDDKFNKLFDEINYDDKKSKKIYNQYKKEKQIEYKKIILDYKSQIKLRHIDLKEKVIEIYAQMNEELNKFRLYKIENNKKQLDLKTYLSLKKYRKEFSIHVLDDQEYEHYELDKEAVKKDKLIYSVPAIKKNSAFVSKNVVDKVEIRDKEIVLYYLVNNEYEEFKFCYLNSAVVFRENSKYINRYSEGNSVKLNLIELITTKDNNVWVEEVYIENYDEFHQHYLSSLKANKIKANLI